MSNIPAELAYTSEHEWVKDLKDDNTYRVGITDHAQDELGEVVFVDLPQAGDQVSAGSVVGEIESTKSVSDLFAPVSGEITEVFACGTAAVVTPIGRLLDGDQVIESAGGTDVTLKIRETLLGIQTGTVEDTHGWMHRLV